MSKNSSTNKASDPAAMMRVVARVVFTAAIVWLVYFLRGNVYFRLYPAAVCAAVLTAFVVSSFRTPLVEVIARQRGEVLDEAGRKYCRRVNRAWIFFMSVHLSLSIASVFAPLGVWAFYNGFLSYLLIGSMFFGEWIVRRRIRRRAVE